MASCNRRQMLKCAASIALAPCVAVAGPRQRQEIRALRAILNRPDAEIDLCEAKLAIDRMVDPSIDLERAQRKIAALSAAAVRMVPISLFPVPATQLRVNALRRCLYESGSWNEDRPFRYDLVNDPSGKSIPANKLLPHYLEKRLGNCVSMPALFLVLAQRMGIDAYLATAPEHTFVKVRHEDGHITNHECTHDGGLKADASYAREFEITQQAQANGIYLRPLKANEAVLVMANTLGEHYFKTKNERGLNALADLMLEVVPTSIHSVQMKRSAHGLALDLRYRSRYKRFEDIPPAEVGGARQLLRVIKEWDDRAYALGWRPVSQGYEQRYRDRVAGARGTRGGNP